jgi:hypothetical protein
MNQLRNISRCGSLISMIVIAAIALFLLSGCMHLLMMSGHNEEMKTDSTVEKKIVENNVAVNTTIPAMKMKEKNDVIIQVQKADLKTPIIGADVSFHWMSSKGSGHGYEMSGIADTTMLIGTAIEIAPGNYSFTLSDLSEGHYSLEISVQVDSSSKPIAFEIERTIPMQHIMGMGMMGMGSSTTSSLVIGGAIMASMMIAMWILRGGMYF